ncbi:DNA primase [Halostagnicola larsenii XH-48]|uniref:DNA primase DnaG n=1 Tax=Halostagnicola larsenii XH-48 TaxID=797299 RepID=W0JSQ4_9EURY|nr:DNA primase DnaG [Halostagnicola larsenii]AHG00245.1 DNA primase [Halostagnicola larsenii XH-48]
MEDTSKYLIHADVTAEGVVERSDVVGAVFGQTEGLLGDELDLRDLKQSQKVGRIDVEIASTNGQSHGTLTIATSLDKVETATLAASLETITRIGPCRAALEITGIEDVRAAKRKEVVDRAKELLRTGFDDSVMTSEEILTEVRQHVRVEDITEYEGLPAGPRVQDSDAIIVVEGRSDVLTLLKYGVKNAIAVEGTNVPDAVAELTTHRTVTAFLDGDRGGDLILEELAQVGEVDYVTFAPADKSVEDLDHHQLFAALRNKVPYETISELNEPQEAVAATDGSAKPAPPVPPRTETDSLERDEQRTTDEEGSETAADAGGFVPDDSAGASAAEGGVESPTTNGEQTAVTAETKSVDPEPTGAAPTESSGPDGIADTEAADTMAAESTESDEVNARDGPKTVYEHANEVVRGGTGTVRLLNADGNALEKAPASDAYETLEASADEPTTIVLDSVLEQRLLDLAADRGVGRIVARALGEFTKRPTAVRIHAIDEVAEEPPNRA